MYCAVFVAGELMGHKHQNLVTTWPTTHCQLWAKTGFTPQKTAESSVQTSIIHWKIIHRHPGLQKHSELQARQP